MANEKLVTRETAKKVVEGFQEKLENGQIVPSKSLVAQEIETISPESGDTQETPFALQGTGTANGTSSVDTGTVGKHIQKQGSVYCVNQLVQNGNFADSSGWDLGNATMSISNNIAEITCEDTTVARQLSRPVGKIANHKYLYKISIKLKSTGTGIMRIAGYQSYNFDLTTTNWQTKYVIETVPTTTNNSIPNVYLNANCTITGFYVKDYQCIDLTQWFNGNIPQDLLDHPEHWSWYQNKGDYIPYNTGTLVSGNGKYLVDGYRNVWDEETEINSGHLDSKNYILVNPNTTYYFYCGSGYNVSNGLTYYDKNYNVISSIYYVNPATGFTTPSNCYFIKFKMANAYGTTYKHDITISLYYSGEDYSQYYPYEQPKVYDTGDEELLSTGVKLSVSGEREDIYDYKEPNGLITRRVAKVNLEDLEWTYNSTYGVFFAQISGKANGISNIYCSKYAIDSTSLNWTTMVDKSCRGYDSGNYLYIKDSSLSSSSTPSGTLTYELATPTTEQGTPFSENIEINDFGTMGWYATYTDANTNALVSVPQGCKIFYPAWYVGFVDTLGQRADIDWNANNVVSHSELAGYVKQVDLSSDLTDSAGLTYTIKKIYKIGNIVFLTIRAENSTGSSISSATDLFSLASGLYSTSNLRVFANVSGIDTNALIKNDGKVTIGASIGNNQTLFICCSYAVA